MGQSLRKKVRMALSILLVGLLLISCGTTTETEDVAATDYKYKVTVNLVDEVTKAEIEEAFEGKVVGWYPSSGIATVETNINIDDNSISQQGIMLDIFNLVDSATSTSSKARAVTPVSQNGGSAWANGGSAWANGGSAWANGGSAWANGGSAWANGGSAWANGGSAWANGVLNGYFEDNKKVFQKIKLFQTHEKLEYFGEDVIVAVIDSGLDLKHPMFKDRLDLPEYWKDFVDGDAYPQDSASPDDVGYGHGTAVAGIILQVAPRATILPIRVIGPDGTGDTNDIAAAIEYAVISGASIINLSLGTDVEEPAIAAMLGIANKAGILTIASAGNTGKGSLLFPANIANQFSVSQEQSNAQALNDLLAITGLENTSVLGVSSVSTSDIMSTFSSYGATMDLAAPGESIVTAYPGAKFVSATGTSFAAPLVTGAMALAIGESGLLVSPQVLLSLAAATAKDVAPMNKSTLVNGAGEIPRLDIYKFMSWGMGWKTQTTPTEPQPTEPQPVEPQPTEPQPVEPQPVGTRTETMFYNNFFNNGSGKLVYFDEAFSNNGNNAYAEGISHTNNTLCKTQNTCLEVKLGGKDNLRKDELSGAYKYSFTLDKPTEITLSVKLRTLLASTYESDEYVSSLISVDNQFIGKNNERYISKLIGGGVSPTDSGWVSIVDQSLGVLPAGEHSILIGGYNNKKTYNNEVSSILIDNFRLKAISN